MADEGGGAGGVFVDVVFETLVGDVHLAETGENFVGAGVVVFGNVSLKLRNERARIIGAGK